MNRFLLILSLTAAIAGCEPMSVVFDEPVQDDSGVVIDTDTDSTDDTAVNVDTDEPVAVHLMGLHIGITRVDGDDDGWYSSVDCDDDNATIHPEAADDQGDGVDDNCDGEADESYDPGEYNSEDVVFVDVALSHYCAMDSWDYVYCTGGDEFTVPADLETAKFLDISVNDAYNCGILLDGTVECWGPEAVAEPEGTFLKIDSYSAETNSARSCGVRTDGSVSCWGANAPTETVGEEGSKDVCLGGWNANNAFVCVQNADGAVTCQGIGASTQGIGGSSDSNDRFDAAASEDAIVEGSLSCGARQSCGILEGGSIDCWGEEWSENGEAVDDLGTVVGPFGNSDVFISVATGYNFNCGVKDNGTVQCFGSGADELLVDEDAVWSDLYASGGEVCGIDIQDGTSQVSCW